MHYSTNTGIYPDQYFYLLHYKTNRSRPHSSILLDQPSPSDRGQQIKEARPKEGNATHTHTQTLTHTRADLRVQLTCVGHEIVCHQDIVHRLNPEGNDCRSMSTETPSAKKKKKSKKEKKEKKKKKSSSDSSKKRQREESPDANGKTVKKSNRKRRKSDGSGDQTIYSRLQDDKNNELWLLRVPKTLNLQELDGQEIDVKDNGTLSAELTYSNSQQSENVDSDDAFSDSEKKEAGSNKRQYRVQFAPDNRCSQIVCFLSHDDEDTLSEAVQTRSVKPLRFTKQVNFTEKIVGLPSVHMDKQRLSKAYKGVPQKTKLQYNFRTIGYVDPAEVAADSSVNADHFSDSKEEENTSTRKKEKKKGEKKKKEKKEKKKKKKKSSK